MFVKFLKMVTIGTCTYFKLENDNNNHIIIVINKARQAKKNPNFKTSSPHETRHEHEHEEHIDWQPFHRSLLVKVWIRDLACSLERLDHDNRHRILQKRAA